MFRNYVHMFRQNVHILRIWCSYMGEIRTSEVIRRINIPLSLKQWRTNIEANAMFKKAGVNVVLKGKRIHAGLQIDVIISEKPMQLTLFDEQSD